MPSYIIRKCHVATLVQEKERSLLPVSHDRTFPGREIKKVNVNCSVTLYGQSALHHAHCGGWCRETKIRENVSRQERLERYHVNKSNFDHSFKLENSNAFPISKSAAISLPPSG